MRYERWTEAEDLRLRAMSMAGGRRDDIANSFPGRSPASVHYRMHRLRLRARDNQPKDLFDRYIMSAAGFRMGSFRHDLSNAVKKRITEHMVARGFTTVAAAVNDMLRG